MTFLTQEPLISCDRCGKVDAISIAYPEDESETQDEFDGMDEPFLSESGWLHDTRLGEGDFGMDWCPDCKGAAQAAYTGDTDTD